MDNAVVKQSRGCFFVKFAMSGGSWFAAIWRVQGQVIEKTSGVQIRVCV